MLFNSFEFMIFFPLVCIIYFLTPFKYRWILLLAASYYFYMCWKAEYIVLIMVSTIIDYLASLRMSKLSLKSKKKKYLLLSIFTNLGLLFTFKYLDFFGESVTVFLDQFNIFYEAPAFDLLLPVGISFYTFQTLSYTIDVYRGEKTPEKHLGKFALYVSFFPQLVAGPIERPNRLMPQLHCNYKFEYNRVVDGLRLMLWGLFKKIVIADRLAYFVDMVYNNPEQYYGLSVILATVFFAFQIFCDFSGYSDIAVGAAKVLGINLMNNFDRPYFSKSISEFWKRWHISLSTWFRDYVYISLGGNRVVKWRWYYNLFITFLVSGLWHGAAWTFVIWGALHGLYLVIAIVSRSSKDKIIKLLYLDKFPALMNFSKVILTFILVCFGWVFFRANSLNDALLILNNMFNFESGFTLAKYISIKVLLINFSFIFIMLFLHWWQKEKKFVEYYSDNPTYLRWGLYFFFIISILYFGGAGEQQFIYFQF